MFEKYIERILDSRDLEEASAAYFGAMGDFGFDNVFYVARFHPALPTSVLREGPVIICNFPGELAARMTQPGSLAALPCIGWTLHHDGNTAMASIRTVPVSSPAVQAARSQIIALAARHGVRAGRIISLKGKVLRGHGAVLLNPHAGASHDEAEMLWQRSGRAVTLLSWLVHMRIATLPQGQHDVILTLRQREVLEWSSAGKTISEIATILGLTAATVEKHLRLARQALDAETTAHAVLKAHVAQQIFPDDNEMDPFSGGDIRW